MQSIRTFFIAISAISIMALTTIFTMSLAVVLLSVVAAGSIVRMIGKQLRPASVGAEHQAKQEPRIWNDGKGTIIDL